MLGEWTVLAMTGREDGEHKSSRHIKHYAIELKGRIVEETFAPGHPEIIECDPHGSTTDCV
jgi:hypothetical protein